MKIDTSSYYPEPLLPPESPESQIPVKLEGKDKPEGKDDGDSEEEGFISAISGFLSWVLVPLLMPVYGMMLIFKLTPLNGAPVSSQVVFTLVVAGINAALPMILIFILKKLGFVDDYGLNGRRERLIPYIITIVALGGTAWFMAVKEAPLWICMFFTGGALGGLINLCVNFKWKISAHGAGIAGIVALLIHITRHGHSQPEAFVWLLVWIILAGLLGSARIWLGRHTLAQVLCGFAVGFCSVYFLITWVA